MGIDGNRFRDIEVVLDTKWINYIDFNKCRFGFGIRYLNDPERTESSNNRHPVTVEKLPIIEVTALTAIGQTVENIDVMCLNLHPEILRG